MQRRMMLRLMGQSVSALLSGAVVMLTDTPANAACPRLGGTFLQLTEAQTARSAADWRHLIGELHTLGISNLFIQWTVIDRTSFLPVPGFATPANTPLPEILRLAAQSGIRVWIGLELDSHYWAEIKHGPALLRSYFQERLRRLDRFVGYLNAAVATAPFAGWYITDEIDDKTWLDSHKRAVLKEYLANTVKRLRTQRPGSQVAISGFSNAFADPDLLAALWAELITASGISLLLFQDGIGEGKVAIEDIALYYKSLDAAVRRAGGELGAVIELFSLMPNGQRVPALTHRIVEQIEIARRLTSFPPVAFSVPDYMSDLAGPAARRLLSDFLAVLRRCRG